MGKKGKGHRTNKHKGQTATVGIPVASGEDVEAMMKELGLDRIGESNLFLPEAGAPGMDQLIAAIRSGSIENLLDLGRQTGAIEGNTSQTTACDKETATDLLCDVMRGMHSWQSDLKGNVAATDEAMLSVTKSEMTAGFNKLCLSLLELGADFNEKDYLGWTVLMQAVNCDCYDLVQILLSKDADCTVRDSSGRSALHLAVELDREDHVSLFKGFRALRNINDTLNLQESDRMEDSSESASPEAEEDEYAGYTALMIAVSKGNLETTQLLLSSGADPNIQHKSTGDSALHLAALTGLPEIVDALIASGIDVNLRNAVGLTALFGCNSPEIVHKLVEAKIDVNALDLDGESALSIAMELEDLDVVDILEHCMCLQ